MIFEVTVFSFVILSAFYPIVLWLSIRHSSAYIFIFNLTCSDVEHSWENYIYSSPMRYTVFIPFEIIKISTVLARLYVNINLYFSFHRFCSIIIQMISQLNGNNTHSFLFYAPNKYLNLYICNQQKS